MIFVAQFHGLPRVFVAELDVLVVIGADIVSVHGWLTLSLYICHIFPLKYF